MVSEYIDDRTIEASKYIENFPSVLLTYVSRDDNKIVFVRFLIPESPHARDVVVNVGHCKYFSRSPELGG